MPSLFEICIRVLQENVDDIYECGGLNYDIMKPVLERASPPTLIQIEEYNPHLLEDTGELWQRFVKKNFPKAEREEMETWREMFERCTAEREKKLESLKTKVKDSYRREESSQKKAKLAYVDVVAKPPRGVMKAQARNGTALPIGQPPKKGLAGRPAAPAPAPSAAAARKPKVAPMMAKTLRMVRGMKSGFRR